MSNDEPGRLIGKGRAADVFDIGRGRVLRRNRDGSSTEREAVLMQHLHALDYPVPEVYESSGADLVMERLDGPTMLDAFPRRPWRLRAWARILASLHDRLEGVPLPEIDLPRRFGAAEVLVHGDLHPDNVLLTSGGPMVIDWPNVCIGARGADVASTWIIVATSQIDAGGLRGTLQSAGRSVFLRTFLRHANRHLARSLLADVAAHRLTDRNLRPAEVVNVHELLAVEHPN